MNAAVYDHEVIGNVRHDGSLGNYTKRTFGLMLVPDTQDKMVKESIRILRQMGYETRGITVKARE